MKMTLEHIGEIVVTAVERNEGEPGMWLADLRTINEVGRLLGAPIAEAYLEYYDFGHSRMIRPRWLLHARVEVPDYLWTLPEFKDCFDEVLLDVLDMQGGEYFGTKDIEREFWAEYGVSLEDLAPEERNPWEV